MDSLELAGLKEYVIRTQRGICSTMIPWNESSLRGDDLLDAEEHGCVEEEKEEVNENLKIKP